MALQIARALLIVNPESRRGARDAPGVERVLRGLGIECTVVFTNGSGHAATLAAGRGPRSDAVFVLGGDGTVDEVLGALVAGHTPVGIIPSGSGNLLARALGIPLDSDRAAVALCAGGMRRIDLAVLADGRYFAVAAGVGIDAQMVARASSALKRRAGLLAYVVTGLAATLGAIYREPFRAQITVDDAAHDVRAVSVLVANVGTLFAGRVTVAPDSRMDDGELEVAVYSARTFWQAVRVAWRGWRGRFPQDTLTRFYRGAHIRVATDPRQPVQADGDVIDVEVLDARVAPGAALVLVPAGA